MYVRCFFFGETAHVLFSLNSCGLFFLNDLNLKKCFLNFQDDVFSSERPGFYFYFHAFVVNKKLVLKIQVLSHRHDLMFNGSHPSSDAVHFPRGWSSVVVLVVVVAVVVVPIPFSLAKLVKLVGKDVMRVLFLYDFGRACGAAFAQPHLKMQKTSRFTMRHPYYLKIAQPRRLAFGWISFIEKKASNA